MFPLATIFSEPISAAESTKQRLTLQMISQANYWLVTWMITQSSSQAKLHSFNLLTSHHN